MRLCGGRGQYRITELLAETGISQKHLTRVFQQQIGVSPKPYAQLLKFQHALSLLHGQSQTDFGRLAQDCGYYDQAHFHRDFRRFSGVTPKAYIEQQIPDDITKAMRID